MKKCRINESGITLIALVVTIIVLLILAGITISIAIANNGIIQRAYEAGQIHSNAMKNEITALDEFDEETGRVIENVTKK